MADPRVLAEIAQWRVFAAAADPNANPKADPKADPTKKKSGGGPQSDAPWSERQALIYYFLEGLVAAMGPFDQSNGPNGAHYVREGNNPYIAEGMVCSNCAFYMEGQGSTVGTTSWHCTIVDGNIDPGGLCKFWLIPEDAMTPADPTAQKQAASAARKKKPTKKKWSY